MHTIAMWLLADNIGMGSKWTLLLPIHRSAYIGMVADAHARERGKSNPIFSVTEAVAVICLYSILGVYCLYPKQAVLHCGLLVLVVKSIVRLLEYGAIYPLYFEKNKVKIILSAVPPMALHYALKTRRFEDA